MWMMDHRGRWDDFGYYGFGWMGDVLWAVLLLGLIALVAVLIVGLLRGPTNGKTNPAAPDRALEIARERYARGEISQAEFETLKKNLGG